MRKTLTFNLVIYCTVSIEYQYKLGCTIINKLLIVLKTVLFSVKIKKILTSIVNYDIQSYE